MISHKAFKHILEDLIRQDAFFAAYSLPDEELVQLIIQTDPNVKSITEVPADEEGFSLFPFGEEPGLWVRKDIFMDSAEFLSFDSVEWKYDRQFQPKDDYEVVYNEYMTQAESLIHDMKEGILDKIVLSRIKKAELSREKLVDTFYRLIESYNETFVFLVNLPGKLSWIGASPEKLIVRKGSKVLSMALASTKRSDDTSDWSDKEVEEQAYVSRFIQNALEDQNIPFEKSRVYDKVLNSGIKHLCNDFEMEIKEKTRVSKLIKVLHPTPAVAGIPRKRAIERINEIEKHHRGFYTGFLGPVNINDSTQLFVNLRSAEHSGEKLCLYIGGGLTKDSKAEDEWRETELKADSILRLLHDR